MSSFKFIFFLFTSILIVSCRSTENDKTKADSVTIVVKQTEISEEIDIYDSLANAKVDTSTLNGKREFIMNHFLIENQPSSPDYDSLFDLNYDGYDDYIIGYYGQSGSGFKNRIQVYFYDSKMNCYHYNEHLSDLPNPSFYLDQKKITGFYIGNGGGAGGRLEWINGKWIATKEFQVDKGENDEDSIFWEINYPLLHKKEKVRGLFEMIPPAEILESKLELP